MDELIRKILADLGIDPAGYEEGLRVAAENILEQAKAMSPTPHPNCRCVPERKVTLDFKEIAELDAIWNLPAYKE